MADLTVLNQLTKDLYEAQEASVRQRAERQLAELQASPECPDACMALLQQGELPYAPVVACTTLLTYISDRRCPMPEDQRLYLSQCLLNYLSERAMSLQPFALTAVCHLLARVTKVGWSYRNPEVDEDVEGEEVHPFRTPIWQLVQQLSVDRMQESLLAMQIINKLVEDWNSPTGFESLTKYRKDMNGFRDVILEKIFAIALQFLREFVVDAPSVREDVLPLLDEMLDLALNCVSFNFLGVTEETSEDSSVSFPASWKTCFLDGRPSDMILPLYCKLPTAFTERVLHFAVQTTAMRRTLLPIEQREQQLKHLIPTITHIVENSANLNDSGSFHQFCRLVLRVRNSFHVTEMECSGKYGDVIHSLANFTSQSFSMPQLSQNSIYYLLLFWAKMASSCPQIHRPTDDTSVKKVTPEIFKAYLESRLKNVELVAAGDLEDPLDEHHSLVSTMEELSVISRVDYDQTFNLILRHFEGNVRVLQNTAEAGVAEIAKERLSWLVLFAAAGVFGATTNNAPEKHGKMDGRLAGNCINLMRVSDQSLFAQGTAGGSRHLETAFMFFLDCFRKAYICQTSKGKDLVYETLAQEAQIANEGDLFAFISGKLSNNLKFWGSDEELLDQTLDVFQELTRNYKTIRELLKGPEMQELVQNHADLPFLSTELSFSAMKNRTKFYEAIARLFFLEVVEEELEESQAFEVFFQPFKDRIGYIIRVLDGNSSATEAEMQRLMVALFRDLRGIWSAAVTKPHVTMILDLVYPDLFRILLKCVDEWPSRPEVLIPAFRLLEELTWNRSERYKSDGTFCAGNHIFRHLAAVIVSYTENYVHLPPLPESEQYAQRFKLVASLFVALKHAIAGGYINFGVLRLYEDDSWEKALSCCIRLATSISEEMLTAHVKLAKAFYPMMEQILRSNMAFVSRLDADTFIFILKSLRLGMTFHRITPIPSSAMTSLEFIFDYFFRRSTSPPRQSLFSGTGPEGDECLRAAANNPGVLADIMQLMLHQLLNETMSPSMSMSQALLSLIFLQPAMYRHISANILRKAPEDHRAESQNLLSKLMEGVKRNTSPANKEKFFGNVIRLTRDWDLLKRVGAKKFASSRQVQFIDANTYNAKQVLEYFDLW